MKCQDDLSPSDWIVDQLAGLAAGVASLLPSTFPAYARILHPAYFATSPVSVVEPLSWGAVATAYGRIAHRLMQWEAIVSPRHPESGVDRLVVTEPWLGELDPGAMRRLVELLRPHTRQPNRCWFAFYEGNAGLGTIFAKAPRMQIEGRPMLLFLGALDAALTAKEHFDPRPNLWWANDQRWCVATEVDLRCTYVGGPAALIESILNDDLLDAWPAHPADEITAGSDTVNART